MASVVYPVCFGFWLFQLLFRCLKNELIYFLLTNMPMIIVIVKSQS